MARRVPRWLIICSLILGVVLLVVVGTLVGSVLLFRDAIHEFETADATMDAVADRFGPAEVFRASPDGRIPPDRVEAFLAARASMAPAREETDQSLALLSGEAQDVRFATFRKVGAGVGLLHTLAGFVTARNEALLDVGMGLGEYYHLYTLIYFSWLEHSPADGPSFTLVGDQGYVMEETIPGQDESAVRERRSETTRRRLNEMLLPVLQNQLVDLNDEPGDAAWHDALTAEIAALEANGQRTPWQDGLPDAIESSLSPYRAELAAAYSPMCNAIDIGLARR